MANHGISFTINDPIYRLLLDKQEKEGKHFSTDGKPISADVYAKELLCDNLDPEGKFNH